MIKADMKKIFIYCLMLVVGLLYVTTLSASSSVSANTIPIAISTPAAGINPNADIGHVLGNVITIIFVLATLAVLFMLIIGAFQYITSGGEKDGASKARSRITNALIGLVILAVAFLLVKLLGSIVNVDLLHLKLPSLDDNACGGQCTH